MTIFRNIFFLLLIFSFLSCKKKEESVGAKVGTAKYKVTFESTWSSATHPQDFPFNPHFSSLIGMTHKEEDLLFKEGELASAGIKDMAERGVNTELSHEIDQLILLGRAELKIQGKGIGVSPGSTSAEFIVSASHPYVSLVSMLAPSPDWFVAVEHVEMLENGEWLDRKIVELKIYDAGTDSGSTYASADQVTSPQGKIRTITDPPLAENGVVSGLGTMTFERLE